MTSTCIFIILTIEVMIMLTWKITSYRLFSWAHSIALYDIVIIAELSEQTNIIVEIIG